MVERRFCKPMVASSTLARGSMGNIPQIANGIKRAIDEWCVKEFSDEPREHLGASVIGRECDREIWYSWRWFSKARFKRRDRETGEELDVEPSMRRLFQRGHAEEDRFVSYLRGIGCEVYEFDPNRKRADGSPDQFKISDVDGHFGGSADAIVKIPARLTGFPEDVWAIGEFKTYGVNAWKKLKAKGGLGRDVKFEHLCQFSTYAFKYNLRFSVYLAICKNDDDLHVEFHQIDQTLGERMLIRANSLIRSRRPPNRISNTPTDYKCTFCDSRDVCHFGKAPLKNCRTCVHSMPIENARWACEKFKHAPIERAIQLRGCESYEAIR